VIHAQHVVDVMHDGDSGSQQQQFLTPAELHRIIPLNNFTRGRRLTPGIARRAFNVITSKPCPTDLPGRGRVHAFV
jgi:hypothetical protein